MNEYPLPQFTNDDPNIESMQLSYMGNMPTPIQFSEALYRLVNYFKGRGLTNVQVEKAFDYCLNTHGTK